MAEISAQAVSNSNTNKRPCFETAVVPPLYSGKLAREGHGQSPMGNLGV